MFRCKPKQMPKGVFIVPGRSNHGEVPRMTWQEKLLWIVFGIGLLVFAHEIVKVM